MNEHCEYECVDYEKHEKETILFPTSEEILKIASLCIGIMLTERKKQKMKHEQEMEDETRD